MITLKSAGAQKGQPNMHISGIELQDLIGRDFHSMKHMREEGYRMLPPELKGCHVEYVVLFADGSTRKFVV